MRALITGASGFLGKECVRQFLGSGWEVVTTDVRGSVDLQGDLADMAFVDTLPDADVIINCAAVQYVTQGVPLVFRRRFFQRNNVLVAKNLVHRYRETPTHFIHVGTSMMYRQTGQGIYTVSSPKQGEGVYSESKVQAQAFIDSISGSATVVPCIIGGEGREGLFRSFVRMMTRFGFVAFPGRGQNPIGMVHVHDVASLIVQVARVRASGLFNAAARSPLSIRQWIDEMKDEIGSLRVTVLAIPLAPIKLLAWLTGFRLLAREQLLMLEMPHILSIDESIAIGWEPKFSNAEIARGIARHLLPPK